MKLSKLTWCICMVESSGDQFATRYEEGFRRRYLKDKEGKLSSAEIVWRATSHGWFQIMGQVARELGFTGTHEEFLLPENQVAYARKLSVRNARQLGPSAPLWRHVEAWNKGAGGAKKLKAPSEYFHKVMAFADDFKDGVV